MGFDTVYGSLIEIFPQVDTRILRAVAIEHPNDADEAAAIVLSDILPTLPSNPFHNLTQSFNKSKRERELERELRGFYAKFPGLPGDSSSSSSGTIPLEVALSQNSNAPSTGFHVAPDSRASAYSSETAPMLVRRRNFNAPSTGFPVASDSKSSDSSSSSRTIPSGIALIHNFNAPSTTGFHVAPNSRASAYSSSGTAPTFVRRRNLNAPSTGLHVASDSKSSDSSSSSGTAAVFVRRRNLNAPSTGFHVTSDSKSSASSGTIPSTGFYPKFNPPSAGFHVAPDSKSSAYSSSSGTAPMGVSHQWDYPIDPRTDLFPTWEELLGPDGFYRKTNAKEKSNYVFGTRSAAPCEAQIRLDEPKDDDTASVVSPITIRRFVDDIEVVTKLPDPTTTIDSPNALLQNAIDISRKANPQQVSMFSEVGSQSTNVVEETSKGSLASENGNTSTHGCNVEFLEEIIEDARINKDEVNLGEGNEDVISEGGDSSLKVLLTDEQRGEMRQETEVDGDSEELSDEEILFQDEYLKSYSEDLRQQELAEEQNQQESTGELTPNFQLATTSAESSTSIGSENAVEKLVDLTTPGDNTTNIEEDSSLEAVPASTNVVDETSNGDSELDGALNTSTNGCNVDHLEEIIEEAKINKKALATAMESVTNLMREVEIQEKDAEKTKEEAAKGGLDTLEKVEELKKMLKHAKEANDMHAGEVYGEKSILATEVKELENRLLSIAEERNNSLAILDEMREALEIRLADAMEMKNAAEEEKKEKEDSAHKVLAEQEAVMEKVVQESKLLQQEAEENSKLREFLMDRGQIVDSLQGEISVICQDVKMLKENFDNRVSLTRSISSVSQTSSQGTSVGNNFVLEEHPFETFDELPSTSELLRTLEMIPETPADSSMNKLKIGDDRIDLLGEGWNIYDKELGEFVMW